MGSYQLIVCLNERELCQCLALTFARETVAKRILQSALSPAEDLLETRSKCGQAGLNIFLGLVVIRWVVFEQKPAKQ